MNLSRSLSLAAVVAAAGLSSVFAMPAQAANPSAGAVLEGNPVPGLCMLSREAVFAQSKVGQAASERLKQLATAQQAQLETQRKPIADDIQAFQQKAKTLTEAQREQQGAALQQRMQAFQKQAGELEQRVELTRSKAMQQIGDQAQPIVVATYGKHGCGLLLNRDAVLGGNTTNDLTAEVVKGLDAKLTTLNFNLEPLPAGAAK